MSTARFIFRSCFCEFISAGCRPGSSYVSAGFAWRRRRLWVSRWFFFFQPLEGDADLKPGLGVFSPLSPLLPVCMTTSANVVNVGSALACVDFLSSRFPCCWCWRRRSAQFVHWIIHAPICLSKLRITADRVLCRYWRCSASMLHYGHPTDHSIFFKCCSRQLLKVDVVVMMSASLAYLEQWLMWEIQWNEC